MKKYFFIVLLTIAIKSYGEPSGIIKYLMSEPLTLLEWGLYKLEKIAADVNFKEYNFHTGDSSVYYDWERNKIEIGFVVYTENVKVTLNSPEEICKDTILHAREFINRRAGYVSVGDKARWSIAALFRHEGFSSNSEPKSFWKEIEEAIFLESSVYSSENGEPPYDEKKSCELAWNANYNKIRFITEK